MENTTNAYALKALPDLTQLQRDLLQTDEDTAFLCYDIRHLRKINRAYGRGAGDALLAAVAEWTERFPDGKLYRVEGDAFCLAFRNTGLRLMQQYAEKLETRFGRAWPISLEGKKKNVFAQASIAVVGNLAYNSRLELPDLLEQALEISRMSQQFTVFTAEQDRMTRERTSLQMELKNCLLSGMQGFSVVYQPMAEPVMSTWCGLEALCRWTSSVGPIPPGIFIPEAEDMGLIHRLGDWVLDTALRDCKRMRLDMLDRFFISVNVSALQMNRRGYVYNVLQTLEKHRYPADKLLLEITESTKFSFNDTTMSAIGRLRSEGVLLALDDFGTGYSGFNNLKNLPVDMLKTDRGFIEDIASDSHLQYFYYIISETAHAGRMRLIAEGIETQEELRYVMRNGADLMQGYLFGRPMDMRSIEMSRSNFTQPLRLFANTMNELADLQRWIYSQDAYKITPALFRLQNKCIRLMLEETDMDQAVEAILAAIGGHFKVNRAYVFLREEGTIFSNAYEWCAEGIAPQKHLFQHVDARRDGFYDVLLENEIVIAQNAEQLPENLKERLKQGAQEASIQAMVVMPMQRHGDILGFVGFDDCNARKWLPEEMIILHNLCLFCLVTMAKKEWPDMQAKD